MPEAYIYDAVRTPRGRGKEDGSCTRFRRCSSPPALREIKDRNQLDTKCRSTTSSLAASIPSANPAPTSRAPRRSLPASATIRPACRSTASARRASDAVNFASAQVMSGQHDLAIGGGVESMSRVGMGSEGGAWPVDPSIAIPAYFMPQGVSADLIATKYGFSRDDVDAYAIEIAEARRAVLEGRPLQKTVTPVRDVNGVTILDHDEHMRPDANMQSLASLKPSFTMMGEQGGFDALRSSAIRKWRRSTTCITPAIRGHRR